MAKPNKNAKLGSGGRFAYLKHELGNKGARNPGGLAAFIGRKKYGAGKMSQMSVAGRRRA